MKHLKPQRPQFNTALFLILLPMVLPLSVFELTEGTQLLSLIRLYQKIAGVTALAAAGIRFYRTRRMPLTVLLFGVLETWIFFMTLFKNGVSYAYDFMLNNAIQVAAFALITYVFEDRIDTLLLTGLVSYEWLIFVNLATQLIWGTVGLYAGEAYREPSFFLGHKNQFIGYAYPVIFFALVILDREKKRKGERRKSMTMADPKERKTARIVKNNAIVSLCAACLTVFLSDSSTGKLALLISAALYGLNLLLRDPKWLGAPVVFSLAAVADLLLSIFRISRNWKPLSVFLESVLHRSTDLTGRIGIWDSYYEVMRGFWMFGRGYAPATRIFSQGMYFPNAQNQYFEFLYQGGMIGLEIFLAIWVLMTIRLARSRGSEASRAMTAILTGLMFVFILEPAFYQVYILYMLALDIELLNE